MCWKAEKEAKAEAGIITDRGLPRKADLLIHKAGIAYAYHNIF
jgi:hypothetical protein